MRGVHGRYQETILAWQRSGARLSSVIKEHKGCRNHCLGGGGEEDLLGR